MIGTVVGSASEGSLPILMPKVSVACLSKRWPRPHSHEWARPVSEHFKKKYGVCCYSLLYRQRASVLKGRGSPGRASAVADSEVSS